MHQRSWLDALTDGQFLRDLLSLLAHFFFGIAWLALLAAGYSTALGLSFILIGIPMVLLMLASTRTLAQIDQRMMANILNVRPLKIRDDIDPRGANLGERLGMYLGSGDTWRAFGYLMMKIPLGLVGITVVSVMLPLIALEMLILAPLTIDLRFITLRMLHWFARGLYNVNNLVLPRDKDKNEFQVPRRLQTNPEDVYHTDEDGYYVEETYYLDDDGELRARRGR